MSQWDRADRFPAGSGEDWLRTVQDATPEEVARARVVLAVNSRDAGDLAMLLDMLGLEAA